MSSVCAPRRHSDRHQAVVHVSDDGVDADRHSHCREGLGRPDGQGRPKGGQDAVGAFQQQDAGGAGSMRRKLPRRVWWATSATAPASSTPVGPPPTTTNVNRARTWSGSASVLGLLEGRQHAATNLGGVLDGLQPGCQFLPRGILAEVMVMRPGGHEEGVVIEGTVTQQDAVAGGVEAGDLGHQHDGIPLAAQDGPQRRGDVGRRQRPGRYLIEQRLEQVEIAPVEEGDPHRRRPGPAPRTALRSPRPR